jgi:predicted DNA-binding transcriptional regulator YafY
MRTDESLENLVLAIAERRRVRLVYQRQADEVTTIHEVAPMDLRPGDTQRTAHTVYLWAWCFAEDRLELHLMSRVKRADLLDGFFDPAPLLARWPEDIWPRFPTWNVPRDWT